MTVELPEPARLRLLAAAAQVLGRLPADEVPAPLRAIARFTPAKRARLGGAQLAAVLDTDEQFRGKVAEAVEEGVPELFASVRAEAITADSIDADADPLDAAVVVYLARPDGWAGVLGELARRWTQTPAAAAGEQIAALQAEVADLRTAARSAVAGADARVEAETAHLRAEVADLRNQVRARTRELRAAERTRDAALEQAQALTAGAQAAIERRLADNAAEYEAQVRRLRGRVSELENASTAARRDARLERGVEDARLWLLVETLTDAAAGIRRELALSPTTLRPADTVVAAEVPTGSKAIADVAALDRLLSMPRVHLIADGYNVTKTGYGDLSLVDQRVRLMGALAGLAGQTSVEVTIAFDGGTRPPVQPPSPRGVRVLFSAEGQIADDLIRDLVAAEPEGRQIVVVTSDQAVVADVRRAGAWTVPSAVLLSRLA